MTEPTPHLTEDQLQGWLDGVLDPRLASRLHSHLEDCRSCQERLGKLEALGQRLESLPALEPSQDLSSLVVARLREDSALAPALTWTLVVEALGAGALLAGLLPALQAAGWLPRLLYAGKELQAGLRVFLAQLASSWLVWWTGLRLQLGAVGKELLPAFNLPGAGFSPWILLAAAGGLGILFNYLLLGRQTAPGRNH